MPLQLFFRLVAYILLEFPRLSPPSVRPASPEEEQNDFEYDAEEEQEDFASKPGVQVKALYDYDGVEEDELSFHTGMLMSGKLGSGCGLVEGAGWGGGGVRVGRALVEGLECKPIQCDGSLEMNLTFIQIC